MFELISESPLTQAGFDEQPSGRLIDSRIIFYGEDIDRN